MTGYCTAEQSVKLSKLGLHREVQPGEWAYDERHRRTFIYQEGMTSPKNLVRYWNTDELGAMIPNTILWYDKHCDLLVTKTTFPIDQYTWFMAYEERDSRELIHLEDGLQLSICMANTIIWLLLNNIQLISIE